MDLDRPRGELDDLAVARQIVSALALHLDRRITRRGLLDDTGELRQQRADRLGRWPSFTRLHHLSFGIVSVALLAPTHREAVTLAAIHHEGNGLGRFAERDRQAAGSERIERAGMAGTLGREQPLHHGDRLRRRHADRLVEHDPAMDVALVASWVVVVLALLPGRTRIVIAARLVAADGFGRIIFRNIVHLLVNHALGGSCNHQSSSESGARSLCTAGVRNNFSIRSASSNRSSTRKRMSGANFRLTRRATSPRRCFLLRSSAASTMSVSRPPSGMT